jgi:hypothetical protein
VCELDDLGFVGDVFTWRNKQTKSSSHIRERIDRAVANAEWRMMFPFVQVRNGDPYHSDHKPIVVETKKLQRRGRGGGGNSFHFEASWCKEVIEEAWGSGVDDDRRLGGEDKGCDYKSKGVERECLGRSGEKTEKGEKELEKWRKAPISDDSLNKEAMWSFKVERLEEQIDLYRRQRAHVNWLCFGDKNTIFFITLALVEGGGIE